VIVVTAEFDAAKAIAAMKDAPARTQKATVRALNRALTTGRAEMARLIAADLGLRIGETKKEAISVEEATPTRLSVRLVASRRRLPLKEFNARGSMPSRGKGRGVSYRIGSGGRGRVENAFLARMASGHIGVFKRTTKKRLPVIELFGPSIGRVFEQHRPAVVDVMREAFNARLDHELKFAFKGGGGA
jgi:hypothetical protein